MNTHGLIDSPRLAPPLRRSKPGMAKEVIFDLTSMSGYRRSPNLLRLVFEAAAASAPRFARS